MSKKVEIGESFCSLSPHKHHEYRFAMNGYLQAFFYCVYCLKKKRL